MGDIPGDTGEGLDIRHLASGTDIVGVFPSGNFTGSVYNFEIPPSGLMTFNLPLRMIYSGTAIGSIYYLGTGGSYLQVLSYSGTSSVLTDVSDWTSV